MLRRATAFSLALCLTTFDVDAGSTTKLRGGSPSSNARATTPKVEAFRGLIASKAPWGIYDAALWSSTDNVLPEATGNGRDVSSTGSTGAAIANGLESGNGAAGKVAFIKGSTTSSLHWPTGSIPDSFTICSVTRYTGGSNGRILQGNRPSGYPNWLHGHHYGWTGRAYYSGTWVTSDAGNDEGPGDTNWVVTCGNNGISTPENVLSDGKPIGIRAGGQGGTNYHLCINPPTRVPEVSDWALSYVVIWDQHLTSTEMMTTSDYLMNYLATGESLISKQGGGAVEKYDAYSFAPQTVSTTSKPDAYTSILNFPLLKAKLGDVFRITTGFSTTHPGGNAVPCKVLITLGNTKITDRLAQASITKSTKESSFTELVSTITILSSTSQVVKMNSNRFTLPSANETDYLGLQQGTFFASEDLWHSEDPKFFDVSVNVNSDGKFATAPALIREYFYVERLRLPPKEQE